MTSQVFDIFVELRSSSLANKRRRSSSELSLKTLQQQQQQHGKKKPHEVSSVSTCQTLRGTVSGLCVPLTCSHVILQQRGACLIAETKANRRQAKQYWSASVTNALLEKHRGTSTTTTTAAAEIHTQKCLFTSEVNSSSTVSRRSISSAHDKK
ncbi:uncharacterized protein V6R79_011025 [Siganus canaliculatus]